MHFDVPLFLATLPVMAKGMAGIFAVMLVIWGLVAILNAVTKKKTGQ